MTVVSLLKELQNFLVHSILLVLGDQTCAVSLSVLTTSKLFLFAQPVRHMHFQDVDQ